MMKVKLYILYKKFQIINETCKENNIKNFMKKIINQNKINIQSGVSFLFLDYKYRLLSLSSKVPEKLLVIAIDINELYERNELHKKKLNINKIKPFIYNKENIITGKQDIKKNKEKIELTKEEFEQIIKPVIIKEEKKRNDICLNQQDKIKNKKTINKVRKKVSKPKCITIKKEDLKIIKKNVRNIRKRTIKIIDDEKKPVINKSKNSKPKIIKMIINLKKDYIPLVTILKVEKPKERISIIEHVEKKHISRANVKEQKNNNLENLIHRNNNKKDIIEEIIMTKKTDVSEKTKNKTEVKSKIIKVSNEKNITQSDTSKDKSINRNEMNKTKKAINNQEGKVEEIEKTKEEKMQQNISYSIVSPDNDILYHVEITNSNPMTVEELLLQSGLEINNANGFVESINGIENKGMSGWVFEVNNLPVMVPASKYVINPSDQITWKYVDFSKMMKEEQSNEIKQKSFVKQNNKGGSNEKKAA